MVRRCRSCRWSASRSRLSEAANGWKIRAVPSRPRGLSRAGYGRRAVAHRTRRKVIDQDEAAKLEQKLRANEFTLEDFRDQLRTIRKMGPLEQIMGCCRMGNIKQLADNKPDEKQLGRIEAIIGSMTPENGVSSTSSTAPAASVSRRQRHVG